MAKVYSVQETPVKEAWEQEEQEWQDKVNDPVNHPSHYTYGKIEVIDFIEDKSLNFHKGNAVKYIARSGHKNDEIEDLKKAVWYLNREIQRLEAQF